jgi:arginyl-tRNA synthetase
MKFEKDLIKLIYQYPMIVKNAGDNLSPSTIANFSYEISKSFNHYYQDTPILKRVENEVAVFRIVLSWFVGKIIKHSCRLLGIKVTERM